MSWRTVTDSFTNAGGVGTGITTAGAFDAIGVIANPSSGNIGTGAGLYLDVFSNSVWVSKAILVMSSANAGAVGVPTNGSSVGFPYCQGLRVNLGSYSGTATFAIQLLVHD